MRIKAEQPQILRFTYRSEPDDPDYGACLWAVFDLDPQMGLLNIQSDCGNYAYRWPERGEDFIDLLSGHMSEAYLLGKICGEPTIFNSDKTMQNIRQYLDSCIFFGEEDLMYLNKIKIEDSIKHLGRLFSLYKLNTNPDLATYVLESWNLTNDLDIDCVCELIVQDYTPWQKRIVRILLSL